MLGLWLENRKLGLQKDLPLPAPGEGEALVRVLRAGICNTDLELVKGYYPYTGVLGHEFVGVMEESSSKLAGQRVVGEINAVCHRCDACRSGRPTHCERRTVLGIAGRPGAFAGYLTLPLENLHAVPDALETDAAVFTEPLAAALEIQEQVAVDAGCRVLVVGDGKLGQLVARSLALTGCELLVLGRHRDKLALLSAVGIATALSPSRQRGFDLAVECTGNPAGFALAREALRPRGTLVMKSTYAGDLSVDAASLVVDEITLVGSRCGPFPPALQLLAQRKIDPRPLITGRLPLADGLSAMKWAEERGSLKILLDME